MMARLTPGRTSVPTDEERETLERRQKEEEFDADYSRTVKVKDRAEYLRDRHAAEDAAKLPGPKKTAPKTTRKTTARKTTAKKK
jgi:hypothetical protein